MGEAINGHAIIIPSVHRPEVLYDTVLSVLAQIPPPDEIIVAVHQDEDYLPKMIALPGVRMIKARLGAALQRNDAIAALSPGAEFVTFLDDDVELAPGYLAYVRVILSQRPEVVSVGGAFIRNGGVMRAEAIALAKVFVPAGPVGEFIVGPALAGNNMSVRRSVLRLEQFDERFRLDSWLEDADFGRRCARRGVTGNAPACALVHLGCSSGNTSDVRRGFSQIMNPYYLYRKGFESLWEVLWRHWLRVVRNNFVLLLLCDRRVNRWQRLKGNCIAFGMILHGRCEPEYVENIP